MLAGVVEQNQVHVRVRVVLLVQGVLQLLRKFGHVRNVVLGEVVGEEGCEHQKFGVLLVELLIDASVLDVLLDNFTRNFELGIHVFG